MVLSSGVSSLPGGCDKEGRTTFAAILEENL